MAARFSSTEAKVSSMPFPASSKSSSSTVNGLHTAVSTMSFADKILITITQTGSLAHWIHVPLAMASADPMNLGPLATNPEAGLLPMSHLTATTVLGGTKRDDEVVGQTLATTIASAILMKRPTEERLLVLGIGVQNAASNLTERAQFEEVIGLVLDTL